MTRASQMSHGNTPQRASKSTSTRSTMKQMNTHTHTHTNTLWTWSKVELINKISGSNKEQSSNKSYDTLNLSKTIVLSLCFQ